MIKRYLRALTGGARVDYLAYYHMNVATPDTLTRHLDFVSGRMARL